MRLVALSAALATAAFFGVSVSTADAARLSLQDYVRGRVIVPTQACGLAWYVYPGDNRRYTLGKPSDATRLIQTFGLGVRHQLIAGTKTFPAALSGQILLDVDDRGKAYYVNPADSSAHYLGNSTQALDVLRRVSVGVTDADRLLIPLGDPSEANGCTYHRPNCPTDYDCMENSCVLKAGCAFNNPNCGKSQVCVNNQCVEKKAVVTPTTSGGSSSPSAGSVPVAPTGCAYGTLSCGAKQECVNNVCQLKPGEACSHPDHSVCIPPGSRKNLWQCLDDYFEFDGQCYPKAKAVVPRVPYGSWADSQNSACEKNHGVGSAWSASDGRCVCKEAFAVAPDSYSCEPVDRWCFSRTGTDSYFNFILSSCVCKAGHVYVGSSCQ